MNLHILKFHPSFTQMIEFKLKTEISIYKKDDNDVIIP